MFGEYDDFHQDTAHVPGALINRFCRAAREGWPHVEVWGDGSQVRDFMDVKEFIRVVLELIPSLNRSVLNIGPGKGTSIRCIAETIKHCSGFTGEIFFNPDRYVGVRSKFIDTTKLEELHGLTISSDHGDGLARTISWYHSNWRQYQDKCKFAKADPVTTGSAGCPADP
jgi:GDP-L-fucose synthase